MGGDYGRLRRKILIRSALMLMAATVLIWFFYVLFLYQRFANFAVAVFNFFCRDYERALLLYTRYVRNYFEVYFFMAVAAVFVLILHVYLKSFTRYFNEINNGINSILDRSTGASLSPELAATERKINSIKSELDRREQASREAEKRKNDLVMYLAHDIRTPLTSVIGYLDLLEEAPDMPPEQRAQYVHIALDKAYRLEKMVSEFFEITRYNVQEMVIQKEKIDLNYLFEQLTDELSPIFGSHGNTVKLCMDEDLTVYGDPDKLGRVFNNVMKNAAAYSYPDSQILITGRQSGDRVVVAVQNAGPTIPRDTLSRLFERFYRMDEARSSDSGGAGLGLAIAREIVLRHDGTIRADSDNDTIVFTVALPGEGSQNLNLP